MRRFYFLFFSRVELFAEKTWGGLGLQESASITIFTALQCAVLYTICVTILLSGVKMPDEILGYSFSNWFVFFAMAALLANSVLHSKLGSEPSDVPNTSFAVKLIDLMIFLIPVIALGTTVVAGKYA